MIKISQPLTFVYFKNLTDTSPESNNRILFSVYIIVHQSELWMSDEPYTFQVVAALP